MELIYYVCVNIKNLKEKKTYNMEEREVGRNVRERERERMWFFLILNFKFFKLEIRFDDMWMRAEKKN